MRSMKTQTSVTLVASLFAQLNYENMFIQASRLDYFKRSISRHLTAAYSLYFAACLGVNLKLKKSDNNCPPISLSVFDSSLNLN